MKNRMSGLDIVLGNLNRQIKVAIPQRAVPALHDVGTEIIAKAIPITPVATGNLRRSYGHEVYPSGHMGIVLIIRVDANYAVYVHERMDLTHRPPTRAKFLEITLKQNTRWILQTIARGMRLR